MKKYIIYRCINNINNKIYIGFTSNNLNKRIIEHKSNSKKKSNYIFHKAIRKYGINNFTWDILLETEDKSYALDIMEPFFIKEYDTYYNHGKGYNMTWGGQGGMLDKKHSKETKEKMKLAWTKRENRISNPDLFSWPGVKKSADKRRGLPSWNKGKKATYVNGGKKFKGKTWYKDEITGKRVWVI